MIPPCAPTPPCRRCPRDDRQAAVCLAHGLRTGERPLRAAQSVTYIVAFPSSDLPHASCAPTQGPLPDPLRPPRFPLSP